MEENSCMQNDKSTEKETNLAPVIITLIDGESLKGAISVPREKCLGDILNGDLPFILFKVDHGELVYLARKTIAVVQSNKMPDANQLSKAKDQVENSSPRALL